MISDKTFNMDRKICSRCNATKPISEYYTKGIRVDAACKVCVKSRKRKTRGKQAAGKYGNRLQQIADLIEHHEMCMLDKYYIKIKEIAVICEQRQQTKENQQ